MKQANLYNYEIKDHKGKTKTFEGTPNNQTKEQNLKAWKDLFKTAKMSGKIYNQIDKNEYYIFSDGEEIESQKPTEYGQIKIYIDDLEGYHEIKTYKEPRTININGENITFDKTEIEQFAGALGGQLETFIFYYLNGEIVRTD